MCHCRDFKVKKGSNLCEKLEVTIFQGVHSPNNEFEGGCLIQGQKTIIECVKSAAFFMVDKLKGHSPKYQHFVMEKTL
jgi:hypothetical protein